jgi:hypothetical protein
LAWNRFQVKGAIAGFVLWNRVSKWGTFCFVLFEMMLNLPRDGRWGACRHLRSSVLVFFVYSFSIYIVLDSSIVLVRHKKCDIFFWFLFRVRDTGRRRQGHTQEVEATGIVLQLFCVNLIGFGNNVSIFFLESFANGRFRRR